MPKNATALFLAGMLENHWKSLSFRDGKKNKLYLETNGNGPEMKRNLKVRKYPKGIEKLKMLQKVYNKISSCTKVKNINIFKHVRLSILFFISFLFKKSNKRTKDDENKLTLEDKTI